MRPVVRLYVRALFVAALLTLVRAGDGAAASTCEFLREDGTTRECTFTEKWGECLWTSLESYYDCQDWADSLLDDLVCEVAVQVDTFACNLEAVGELGKLLSPF